MPPKKDTDGKKKKEASAGSNELTPEEQIKFLKLTIDSLHVQLADRSEETSLAIHGKDAATEKLQEMSKALDDEKQSKFELVQAMTRQNKEMESEYLAKEKELESTIKNLKAKIEEEIEKHEEIVRTKDALIDDRDSAIDNLKLEITKQKDEFNQSLLAVSKRLNTKIEDCRHQIVHADIKGLVENFSSLSRK